jgi:preprotein translocase subunit SecD
VMVTVAAALLLASMVMVALSPGAGTDGFQLRLVVDAASADSEVLTISNTNRASGKVFQETLHLQKQVLLSQSAIQSASVSTNSVNGRPDEYSIGFTLTPSGQKQFAEITRANIGRRLAMVMDGKIISAPRINSEISSGNGQISGNFTAEEAARLATILSKGARK